MIKECLVVSSSEAQFEDDQYDLKVENAQRIESLEIDQLNLMRIHELPKVREFDLLIIEDEFEFFFKILSAIKRIDQVQKVIICRDDQTLIELLKLDIDVVKLITFDFVLSDFDPEITRNNYISVRERYPEVPLVCITNNIDERGFSELAKDIRDAKTSVLAKTFQSSGLYSVFNDRIHLGESWRVIRQKDEELEAKGSPNYYMELLMKKYRTSPEKIINEYLDSYTESTNKAMRHVGVDIAAAIQDSENVFLTGESGSGKSYHAQIINDNYLPEITKTYIKVDCGAIVPNLIETELFGSVKGAFTGAKDYAGAFEQATGGVIFLDEIHNLSLELQQKLLAVIDEKTVIRVGSQKKIQLTIKIIAASNAPDDILNDPTKFRHDLLNRLDTHRIRIPSLRERSEEVEPLARSLAKKYIKDEKLGIDIEFSPGAISLLNANKWGGNIRDLSTIVKTTLRNLSLVGAFRNTDSIVIGRVALLSAFEKHSSRIIFNAIIKNDKQTDSKRHLKRFENGIMALEKNGEKNTIINVAKYIYKENGDPVSNNAVSGLVRAHFQEFVKILKDNPEVYPRVMALINKANGGWLKRVKNVMDKA